VAKLTDAPADWRTAGELLSKAVVEPTIRQNDNLYAVWNNAAIGAWQKVIASSPNDTAAVVEMAVRFVESDAPMQGILKLRDIADADTAHYVANLYLGVFSVRTNQLDKAEQRFRRALAAKPKDTEAALRLGQLLATQPARKADAKKYLQIAADNASDAAIRREILRQLQQID
jgi:Flp pilus assembly protein TadD